MSAVNREKRGASTAPAGRSNAPLRITSSAVGGAIVAGVAIGSVTGPIGAAVGVVLGGIVGEIYDLRTDRPKQVTQD